MASEADAIVIGAIRISYGELCQRIHAIAAAMLQRGLRPGEVTGICLRDPVQHLVHSFALLSLATPQVSLGTQERAEAKRALVAKLGVTQILAERREPWMDDIRALLASSSPNGAARQDLFPGGRIDDAAIYVNTSGATGTPKTFALTFGKLQARAAHYARDSKERRALRTGSIEFDAHRLHRLFNLLAGNSCLFLDAPVTAENVISLCARERASVVHLNAHKLAALLDTAGNVGRLPSETAVLSGGSRIPGHVRAKAKALFTDNLWVLYATSETGTISLAAPDQHERFPEGVGFTAFDVSVELVDESGRPVPPGEIGELRLRKPGILIEGYLDEAGASAKFRDGWFYPGDLLSQKAGEPLIFHGRADDVMLLHSINIFPAAIEDALIAHPDVSEAVAFAVKSRLHGEIPAAAVVLSDAAENRDVKPLLDHCRRILGIRAPRQIVIVDAIPRNAAGKPLRHTLAAL